MSRSDPPAHRAWTLLPLGLFAAALVTACGGDDGATATPTVDPTRAAWQSQLDALPTVDGADRTAQQATDTGLTETYTVPTGAPACLQVLARLQAGGYEVVAGAAADPIDPTTCLTTDPADGVGTEAGTATILARGGSQIALTWTVTEYSVTATDT